MAIEIKNIPAQIPPYKTIGDLGKGTFGVVTKVTVDEKVCALKTSLPPLDLCRYCEDERQVSPEAVEVAIYAKLQEGDGHPLLLRCHAYQAEKDAFTFLMDYFPGQTLFKAYFEREDLPLMPLAEVWNTAEQVVSVLQFFKDRGIIHGDINPNNVLTDGRNIKVIDFGCGAILDEHKLLAIANWASYRSPSVVHCNNPELGPYGSEADTFAAGCVIRALITKRPFCFPYNERVVERFLKNHLAPRKLSSGEVNGLINGMERRTLTAMHMITLGMPTGKFLTEKILRVGLDLPKIPGGIGVPRTPTQVQDLYREVRGDEDNGILFNLSSLTNRMIKWEPDPVEDITREMQKSRRAHVIDDELESGSKKLRGEK